MPKTHSYTVTLFPKERLWVVDILASAKKTSPVHVLADVDATPALTLLRAHQARTGEEISFNAFLLRCVAQMVAEFPALNTYRLGRRKLITFSTVDIVSLIARDVEGRRAPTPYVVRAAETKTVSAIHEEIRRAQAGPTAAEATTSPTRPPGLVPDFVQRLGWRAALRDPRRRQKLEGTVLVSNVIRSAGPTAVGRGTSPVAATCGVYFLSMSKQPWVVDDAVVVREVLRLDMVVDHNVVDGDPVARAGRRLAELIESGFGLPQP